MIELEIEILVRAEVEGGEADGLEVSIDKGKTWQGADGELGRRLGKEILDHVRNYGL